MIATIGTIVSTVISTFIYESNGLIADPVTGLTDYSVLANDAVRNPIISSVLTVVIVASLLAALPYLFCNLSRKDMDDIRVRLEKKKFVKENGIEILSEQEQNARFETFSEESEKALEVTAEEKASEEHITKEEVKKERREFKVQKKAFIKKEIKESKRRGEHGFLRILASEKFDEMIVEQQNSKINK